MFEEASPLPGCCRSYACCAFGSCLLNRAEEKMGIEPSGFCVQLTKAQAPVHMQVPPPRVCHMQVCCSLSSVLRRCVGSWCGGRRTRRPRRQASPLSKVQQRALQSAQLQ